jgi:ribonuclease HII
VGSNPTVPTTISAHHSAAMVISEEVLNLHMTKNKHSLHGIAGIDEAGRGPLIGPMVVCGVLVYRDSLAELEHIGVRDSKLLAPTRREQLKAKIEPIAARIVVKSLPANEIDKLRKRRTMNEIEVMEFAEILKELNPETAYLDAADVNAMRFGNNVGKMSGLLSRGVAIVSEHKADSRYPIVSAASIIAKVERDRIIRCLHSQYGDFGSGYPADPKTIAFVRGLLQQGMKLPPIIRHSWDTVRRILDDVDQTSL